MNSLQSNNKFPDCVYLKLGGTPVVEEVPPFSDPSTISTLTVPSNKIDLKLTLRFGSNRIEIPNTNTKILFGLKRGELKLELAGGTLLLETVGLTKPFELETRIEVQEEHGSETEGNVGVNGKSLTGGVKNRSSRKNTTKSTKTAYSCRSKGTESKPVWEFDAGAQSPPMLDGQITGNSLGTIEVNESVCHIKATFEIRRQSDLYLIESEGLLRAKQLDRNSTAVLTNFLFLRYIMPKLKPFLSIVEGTL